MVAEVLIVSRLVQFAAIMVVFGCSAFRLYGLGVDPTATSADVLTTIDAWFCRVTFVGTTVVLLSAVSELLAVTATMAGSAGARSIPLRSVGCCSAPASAGCGAGTYCWPSSQSAFALRRRHLGGCRRPSCSPSYCWSA